jgi:hypothetical protein
VGRTNKGVPAVYGTPKGTGNAGAGRVDMYVSGYRISHGFIISYVDIRTMEQDTCIPSLAWASIAPSFEGRDAGRYSGS